MIKNRSLFSYSVVFFISYFVFFLSLDDVFAAGASLDDQMKQVDKFSQEYMKKIGLTGATILGSVWAAVKGNLKLTGGIVAIGLILSLYLGWIDGGMKLS